MSKKIEIDLEALANAISKTILNFAQPQNEEKSKKERSHPKGLGIGLDKTELDNKETKAFLDHVKECDKKPKQKRKIKGLGPLGKSEIKPSSTIKESFVEEFIGEVEPENEILNEIAQPTNPIKSFVAPAKAKQTFTSDGKTVAKKLEIDIKKPRLNKFQDNGTLAAADRLPASKYPIPSERREPAQKMEFRCAVCNRTWMAYPSEVPQAFVRFGDSTEQDRPGVKCQNCIAIGVQNKGNHYYE